MKKKLISTYGKILSWLLALLGLHGCEMSTPVAMYGVPSATFQVKGKVTNKATNKPIEGIEISIKRAPQPLATTNANGEFDITFEEFPGVNHVIFAKDIDGSDNGGEFETDSLVVNTNTMKQTEKAKSNWQQGTFEKVDANFNMHPKK